MKAYELDEVEIIKAVKLAAQLEKVQVLIKLQNKRILDCFINKIKMETFHNLFVFMIHLVRAPFPINPAKFILIII